MDSMRTPDEKRNYHLGIGTYLGEGLSGSANGVCHQTVP